MTLLQLKEVLSTSVHLEISKGSAEENRRYCTKTPRIGGPWTHGTLRTPNSSLQCAPAADLIYMARHKISTILMAEKHPGMYLRYRKALGEYSNLARRIPRRWKTKVIFYWGPPGSGKTRLAHLLTRNKAYCAPDPTCQWFDGYNLETDVIIDDLSPDCLPPRSMLLRLLDRYPMQVPVKGGYVNWQPHRIFLTSNYCPLDLWGPDKAVTRRITETVEIK